MHAIIFEGTSEEGRQAHGADGLDLYGENDLKQLGVGDVLWVVTRMGDDRATPALCGRLVVDHVERHFPGMKDSPLNAGDKSTCVTVHHRMSERCAPFVCDAIISWDIWRRKFSGVEVLSDEQGRTLEAEWKRASRDMRTKTDG